MTRVALIGPTSVGKTTTARLLAAQLGVPLVSLDETRHVFLRETAFDPAHSDALKRRDFEAVIAYWEKFNGHVVRRTLESQTAAVFDFGAIHSVYADPGARAEVKRALAGCSEVVLLLPEADPGKSLDFLIERGREPGMDDVTVAMWRRIIGRFITHPSNAALATRTVYTANKTPAQVAAEIAAFLADR